MFDARLRPLIDPRLNQLAHSLAQRGVRANHLTCAGMILAVLLIFTLQAGYFFLSVLLVIGNRLLDGLDGPLARITKTQGDDFGGFLDITADFIFYGAIPLGFALYSPGQNGVAAAFLLYSFIGNGITFLAFAALASKRNLMTDHQGKKSIYYLSGLIEGAETIGIFVLMCLFPMFFDVFAWLFSMLCWISAGARIILARKLLTQTE